MTLNLQYSVLNLVSTNLWDRPHYLYEAQLSMLCVLSQNYQHFFEGEKREQNKTNIKVLNKLSGKLKNNICIEVGQAVLDELLIKKRFCMFLSITIRIAGMDF